MILKDEGTLWATGDIFMAILEQEGYRLSHYSVQVAMK